MSFVIEWTKSVKHLSIFYFLVDAVSPSQQGISCALIDNLEIRILQK